MYFCKAKYRAFKMQNKTFKRHDKLVGCDDAIKEYYIPIESTISLYRVVHEPIAQNDFLVQSEQTFPGLTNSSTFPETINPNSSIEEQNDHIQDWSLSFNLNQSSLEKYFLEQYNRRKTSIQKENFKSRKGTKIAKFDLKPEVGLIQKEPDENGHIVVIEYEGINIGNYIDKEYGFKTIGYDKEV